MHMHDIPFSMSSGCLDTMEYHGPLFLTVFNSPEFAQVAQHDAFIHHRITPEHPRAKGKPKATLEK